MINRELLQDVLEEALKTGGDFAEIYIEESTINSIHMTDGRLENALSGRDFGAGIRIFSGFNSVYAYTNDCSREGLLRTARNVGEAIHGNAGIRISGLQSVSGRDIIPVRYTPSEIEIGRKTAHVRNAYRIAKEFDNEIVQVNVVYGDTDKYVTIANSEGLYVNDRRVRTRLSVSSVASDQKENQTGYFGPGRAMGFEFFDEVDVEWYAREASRMAKNMLHADLCPSGVMPVVIDNGFGGVIFHEACGHALEATSVAKGHSVFSGKLGQRIASPVVTAIDDGTLKGLWGSSNFDDEGSPTSRNVLIEGGILTGYMVDRLNGRRMNMTPTGSSRRESYKYAPTSRMTNTYIAPGTSTAEQILSETNDGLYAKYLGGGSVNPATGDFNFAVLEGYLIKNGKIDRPVRGATLIGKGAEVLMNIDRVGDNLEHGQGMCGSISGSIAANVGQPMIRVQKITVGGRK